MQDRRRRGRFELVVFDCDGVLIDSERLAVPVDAAMLNELGWAITEAEVAERFLGRSAAECNRDIEAHLGEPLSPEVNAEWGRRYEEAFRENLETVRGVTALLDHLETAGVRTCVASSSTHERLELTLGLTELLGRFEDRIFSAEDVERAKPAPDLFLLAAGRLGVDPRRCAVVEDSPFGIAAAFAASMTPFAFVGGLVPRERLEASGAVTFETMSELEPMLLDASDTDALGEELPVIGGVAQDELG